MKNILFLIPLIGIILIATIVFWNSKNETDFITANVEALASEIHSDPGNDTQLTRCWKKFILSMEPPGGIYFRICGTTPWTGGEANRMGPTICKGLTEYTPDADSQGTCHIDEGPAR